MCECLCVTAGSFTLSGFTMAQSGPVNHCSYSVSILCLRNHKNIKGNLIIMRLTAEMLSPLKHLRAENEM